ncbi:MAG: NAD+ synthase [Gammaproteobacteria bacterium]|nr:NAD+ synthase [Gammaproteobacteria bacterium]
MTILTIAMAQINPVVGDIAGNTEKIISWSIKAKQDFQADVVVFPELALTGYPPEDLLFRDQFLQQLESAIDSINLQNPGMCIIFGAVTREHEKLYNSAIILQAGQPVQHYAKHYLPNYGVFDEQRYFEAGDEACVTDVNGLKLGITVCEDIWFPLPAAKSVESGAQVILNLNASPFHASKTADRIDQVKQRVSENKVPVCYVNMVGGQDELVFDGHSFVVDAEQNLALEVEGFKECLSVVNINNQGKVEAGSNSVSEPDDLSQLYDALVLATHDYVIKNGFKKVVLGLSGGIDSALVLAIAVDALGADAVHAIMMPYHYTSDISVSDAAEQAKLLNVSYSEIAISEPVQAFMNVLQDEFSGLGQDVTEENLQARSRGVILMAISNKKGAMLLTTGNKSEMSVGYATLYGDMAGGFAPIKDVSKLNVFALANYRNSISPAIPQRVIDRPPSAELAPDQKDEDSLPPYEILDPILEMYIEQDLSVADIIARGFDEEAVQRVTWLVDMSEYKRRQSPPGVRVTQRAFGKERRYPITSGFKRS